MAGNGEKPQPRQNNEGLTKALIKRHGLEFKPSAAFLAKEAALQKAAVDRGSLERRLRIEEKGTDLLPLRVQLVTMGDKVKKSSTDLSHEIFLNQEEQNLYQETVREFVNEDAVTSEERESIARTLTEVVFQPEVFLPHYKQWKSQWEANSSTQKEFTDFKEYAKDRGKIFIKEQCRTVINAYVEKFQSKSAPELANSQQQAKLEDRQKKALKFIDENEQDLLEYSTLDHSDPKREQLFSKFFREMGFQEAQTTDAQELFENVVNILGAAYVSQKKYETLHGEMSGLAQEALDRDTEIDKSKWNKILGNKLKQSFPEILQPQQQNPVYQIQSADTQINKATLDSAQDVAMEAGGLRIMGYDPVTQAYTVRYPHSELQTTMKIIPKPGSKNLDDATFVFYDRYADKEKGNELRLEKKNLREGGNLIFLKYIVNVKIPHGDPGVGFDVNDILRDSLVTTMIERLLDKKLNDVALTENIAEYDSPYNVVFRFMKVLLKGDSGNLGSFKARIDKIDEALRKKDVAQRLFEEFKKEGTTGFSVSGLLEYIGYQ